MRDRGMERLGRSPAGFTLLEVMVALILGTLVVGGVMGLISVSLQFTERVNEKARIQPILEAAAQELFHQPELAEQASLTLEDFSGAPTVDITLTRVEGLDENIVGNRPGRLYRIQLSHGGSVLEFSLIVPPEESE